MNRKRRARVVVVFAILALGHGFGTIATAQPYVPGEILVKPRPTLTRSAILEVHAARGARVMEFAEALGIERLRFSVGRTVEEMVEIYAADPNFEYAEPNYIGKGGGFSPNDTHFGVQWHHENSGSFPDADIDSVEGWDRSRGDASIRVAILDSGIDSDHPEFSGRILPGIDFVNGDDDPEDDESHGTLVAGLLAANADNSFSVAGVDHFVSIVPVKILNILNLGTTFNLIRGLNFAKDNADVISMSLIGYPIDSAFLDNALQAARDAGAILIACAGNGGIGDADVSGPGASPLTISVGATAENDARASFSGTGSALDLVAPGSNVRTVTYNSAGDTSSFFSGCSAATPVAAGVATLLLSVNPLLTHDEIAHILTSTADDLVGRVSEDTPGRDDFMGHGRLNMDAALASVSPPEPVPSLSFEGWSVTMLLLLAAGCLGARRLRTE